MDSFLKAVFQQKFHFLEHSSHGVPYDFIELRPYLSYKNFDLVIFLEKTSLLSVYVKKNPKRQINRLILGARRPYMVKFLDFRKNNEKSVQLNVSN